MKKIALLIFASILVSCQYFKKPDIKPEDDFLKVPEYKTEPETSSFGATYWYVVVEEILTTGPKENDWTDTDWHRVVKLPTSHFDFVEAQKVLSAEIKGKMFFNFIVQINEESYNSFKEFKEINDERK
jgi:hypothetical protein